MAADPEIKKRQTAKRLETYADNPEIMRKKSQKQKATLAATDPKIKKKRIEQAKKTITTIPNYRKNLMAKTNATYASRQEFHTPYGVFTYKKDAVQALVGRHGFTKSYEMLKHIVRDLMITNPKEWYWVKKT